MRRKLVKQGIGGLTLCLPKKWTDFNNLKSGDEIEIIEEENKLSLDITSSKKQLKKIEINLDFQTSNIIRSYIGGLYRAGYDEIIVHFTDSKIITELQNVVDSLYGLEIFDITNKSCTIKAVFKLETTEIKSHFLKLIYTVKMMQETIINDIKNKNFKSEIELYHFRNNVLKQRDLIARTIIQLKLLDNKTFPYYLLSFNVWNIARDYQYIYLNLDKNKEITKKNYEYLEDVNKLFNESLDRLKTHSLFNIHKKYATLLKKGLELMKTEEASVLVSFCINILMTLQSSNSSILLLNI